MADQGERHASWLELFFDLVAVAGVAQLSHLLHSSPGWSGAGLYVLCFLAFWTAWMCFTVYGNVAAGTTQALPVLAAMMGLAVMAAAVPEIHGDRAKVFALAYVAVRVLSDRAWRGRGAVVVDWPVAQMGAGVVPWIASLWAGDPWRYYLWALGLVLDLVVSFTFNRDRMARAIAERQARASERRPELRSVTIARLDEAHFGERLGLFMIIVLGEGVLMVTQAMSELAAWHGAVFGTAIGSLALLAGLWALLLQRGFGGIPMLADTAPPRTMLLLHCLVAGVLAALASGMGELVESVPHGHVEPSARWLVCAAVAAIGVVGAGAAAARYGWLWGLRPLAPAVLIPALAGLLDPGAAGLVWLLVAAVAGQLLATRRKATGQ
ncbi:low temperature requirement protein A [Amycolatopsis acidicola]|uniref:low temperature requirement protein A n=1 Tax=Amycolatopsis acidicola TaxID=2596893 RepID=UPI00140BA1AF|nr:low temperature requirement protein A [Amycolatopsis acidicola]